MVDILRAVSKKIDDEIPLRRRTIPIFGPEFQWWTSAVKSRLIALGIEQTDLARYIKAQPPEVSRCISRKKPVYELLLDISDALEIPYPVVLPESEDEAMEIARQRRLVRRDAQLGQIKAGVAGIKGKRQVTAITLADVSKWKTANTTEEHRPEPPSPRRR